MHIVGDEYDDEEVKTGGWYNMSSVTFVVSGSPDVLSAISHSSQTFKVSRCSTFRSFHCPNVSTGRSTLDAT